MKLKLTHSLFLGVFFLALTALSFRGRYGSDDPEDRYNRVLHKTGEYLKTLHLSPRAINDDFSKLVLKEFVKNLDDEKCFFLQSDVNAFKKFERTIDDEVNGSELASFFVISDVYIRRLNEGAAYIVELLDKPFDFNMNESVNLDPEKIDFPMDESARKDFWRKRLKYQVLSRFVDYQEEREKNKDNKEFKVKADSTLEREAREQVKKQMLRYFSTKKNKETRDENFSTFINTITALMDPHTNYFPPVDLRSFNESMSGRFYGIGAQLRDEDGHIKITSVMSGGPAWKNGELKENDEIIKVAQGDQEPVDVTGFSISEAIKLIRGSEKGSVVKLTVKKMDGSIKVISIARDEIKMEDTFAKSAIVNQGGKKLGYIYLPEFYNDFQKEDGARCSNDIAKELEKLKASKVDAVMIDLRGNGGGSLSEVVNMVGLFIPEGPVVQVRGRDESPSLWRDRDKTVQYSGPLAVMVDETSASASEIFAAAIQDYGRGVIIGSSSTYGKGTVQRNIPLAGEMYAFMNNTENDDMGAIKLTLQKFYRINGGTTQLRGVTPDIVIPDRLEYLKFREKDNPYSLPWDTIKKAEYTLWPGAKSLKKVIAGGNAEVAKNMVFASIRNSASWLNINNDKDYVLQIEKYKQEQLEVKKVYKDMDSLYRLQKPLEISNIPADTLAFADAKDRSERNKQWLKRIGEDVYIEAASKVLVEMVKQESTAAKLN